MSDNQRVEPHPDGQNLQPHPDGQTLQSHTDNPNRQPHPEYPAPSAQEPEVRQFLLELMWWIQDGTLPITPTDEHHRLAKKFTGTGKQLYMIDRVEMIHMFEKLGWSIFDDLHHGSPWGMVSNNICQVCSLR